jgi:trypsin
MRISFSSVGVVQTEGTISFNTNVRAIAMASAATGGGVSAVVTGWGGTAITGGPAPNNLQALTTTTLTNADCISRHTTNNQRFVLDHKICTFTQAGQGICQGDSGGPLTANNQLIGTVSWNIPCARGFPDAFVSNRLTEKMDGLRDLSFSGSYSLVPFVGH